MDVYVQPLPYHLMINEDGTPQNREIMLAFHV